MAKRLSAQRTTVPLSNFGLLLLALGLLPAGAFAQAEPGHFSCDGRRITSITVTPERPPFAGSAGKWQAVARTFGLHHVTTRPEVVHTYTLLHVGDLCSDKAVVEAERVLRGLPFLADARARTRDDGSGGVAIDIRTTDEVPVLVAGGLRRGIPSAFSIGNQNIDGLGLRVMAGGERPGAYRGAAHIEVADYASFRQPVAIHVNAARDQLGSYVDATATRLFLSNTDRGAWFASYRRGDDFPIIMDTTGDAETVETQTEQWSVGGVVRTVIGPAIGLWGPVALGSRAVPKGNPIFASDSGAFPDDDPALRSTFKSFHSARIGGLLGARQVRFVSHAGLDGLFAPQDIMSGWQVGAVIAPGVTPGNGRDLLLAHSVYLGAASAHWVALADIEAEEWRDVKSGTWGSGASNSRVNLYAAPTSRLLFDVQDNLSMVRGSRIPTQLSLNDPEGGPRGFRGSTLVGGRRNVARMEVRVASPHAVHGADVGLALFADAATLWAGDVPYGVNASRQSVGFSIMAASPTRSKRLYRIDIAVPVQRAGGGGLEIRFTNGDPTVAFSSEPNDVTRARLAPIPGSLFAWPGR